jgi:hypothetical protein
MKMNDRNFTNTFSADQSPETVFDAVNNVGGWWLQSIEGDADKLGAVFYYRTLSKKLFQELVK